jgi:hypothetical protein
MYFPKSADPKGIINFIYPKVCEVLNNSKYGIEIEVKEKKKKRSLEQNKYLFAIYKNIVEFWYATGFIVDSLPLKYITSDFIHEYFKNRFNLKTTTKLSAIEFSQYVDGIQNLMVEQTKGDYEPIYPDNTSIYEEYMR